MNVCHLTWFFGVRQWRYCPSKLAVPWYLKSGSVVKIPGISVSFNCVLSIGSQSASVCLSVDLKYRMLFFWCDCNCGENPILWVSTCCLYAMFVSCTLRFLCCNAHSIIPLSHVRLRNIRNKQTIYPSIYKVLHWKLAPCTSEFCYLQKNLPLGWYTDRYGGGRRAVGPFPGRLGPFLGREEGVGPPLT